MQAREAPEHLQQFTRTFRGCPNDRCNPIGEYSGQGRHVAGVIDNRLCQVADGGLRLGDGVEVAHGSAELRMLLPIIAANNC